MIVEFAAPVSVDTGPPQVLGAAGWINLEKYASLMFHLINTDLINTVTVVIETAQDPAFPNSDATSRISVPPASSRDVQIDNNVRKFYRVSASAETGTALVKWCVAGAYRVVQTSRP